MLPWLRRAGELFAAVAILGALVWAAHTTWEPVRVAGMSMRPALCSGDIVLVRLGTPPRPGQIALVCADGHSAMLHRVVGLEPDGSVRTRGDANPIDDLESAPPSAVKGGVVAVVPVATLLRRWRQRVPVR